GWWNLAGGTGRGGGLAASGSNALIVSNLGGTLVGVTLDGTAGNPSPLDLGTNIGAYVYVSGGLTLDGATVRLGRPDGSTYGGLYFTGAAQAVDGTAARQGTILMGSHSA